MWITVYEVIICFCYITVINHDINDNLLNVICLFYFEIIHYC